MSTFEVFSAAMREKIPVPTTEVVGQVGKMCHIEGLRGVTGAEQSAGLEAGRFFALGRTLTDDTKNPGWRDQFFAREATPEQRLDASPKTHVAPDVKDAVPKTHVAPDVEAGAKVDAKADKKQAFDPRPSPFGGMG